MAQPIADHHVIAFLLIMKIYGDAAIKLASRSWAWDDKSTMTIIGDHQELLVLRDYRQGV